MARVSVLIVNFNSGGRLARCLACLEAQTFRDFEIVVIDNASGDDSIAQARAAGVDAHFLDAGGNKGFAAANNEAARSARGEWLAFLNPDAYARPDWLEEMLAAAERHPWADAFGSTQLQAEDPERIDGAGDVYSIFGVNYRGYFGWRADALPEGDAECFAPCAAAAFFRRETFERLGGFDEHYFCYCEDMDLGFRLRLSGGRAVQARKAVVLHEGSAVSGRKSDFTVYHGNRNRIWLFYKNMPAALLIPLLPIQMAASLALLAQNALRGLGPVYFRALVDGYRGHSALRAQRRAALAGRKISLFALMKAMTWSPIKFARRAADLRPLSGSQ